MTNRYLTPMDQPRGCTRRHAIKVFAACAGGVILSNRLPGALADLPWGEQPISTQLHPDGTPLSLGSGQPYKSAPRQAYPTLTLERGGRRLWTSWAQLQEGREAVLLRSFSIRDEKWGPALGLAEADASGMGAAYESEIAFVGNRLVVVWSQFDTAGWALRARSLDPATQRLGPACRLAGAPDAGEIHWHPAVVSIADRAMVVWQAKRGGERHFRILARTLAPDAEPIGETFEIVADEGRDCCRPAVAAPPSGRCLAVAFERHDCPGTQNIRLVMVDADRREVGDRRTVSTHPASDVSPALAYAPDGELLWVAWHSNRSGDRGWDVTPWYRIAALRTRDNTWHSPVGAEEQPTADERGTVQGFELVRLAVSPQGTVCVLGRASHNFYIQYYSAEGKSPLYRLPDDGWGGRGRVLRGVFDSDGSLWVTRRDLGANVMHRLDGFASVSGPPPTVPLGEPVRAGVRLLTGVGRPYGWPKATGPVGDLKLYFGDIHGHSWQSDGMGDPEASFLRARDIFRDDFHALSDHDHFVGKRLSDAQWQEQKDIAEHYHTPGRFVTLFGQEWTTPRTNRPHGWGHFNIYSADPATPLFDHTDPRWRDLPDLYAALRAYSAIAIPHHIGWTGVPWDAIDPGLTPVVEICSVHGAFEYEGNEPIRHRGGVRGCFYRDGLAAGLRVGVVGGSDQHGLTWHHGVCWKRNPFRAGLAGVWAAQLTRAAILDAFRARRTFATTGVKLQLYFAVNGELMGGTIDSDAPPSIGVDVAVPAEEGRLAWLEIVRDGRVIHRYGGEGQRSRYTFVDEQCPLFDDKSSADATCCYYLRVTLADNNLAWSSPVWVTRV
ncbi:MAG: CehA/McbA family metallohydrolase [Phycisphaerae bacterium]